ncbi:MAG: hypothetical protein IIU55_03310 [Paludibacteraceae bacterium]|nr:hypothetical protein [Paludibacteraceae bacterium]
MKKVLLWIVVLIFPLLLKAEKTHLIITAKDGTQIAFALQDKPQVTFMENELYVHSINMDVSYSLENIATFKYESRELASNSINLQAHGITYLVQNDYILFPALSKDTEVALYTIMGTKIFSTRTIQDGEYIIPVSHLVPTVYVLKVNGLTCKMLKR